LGENYAQSLKTNSAGHRQFGRVNGKRRLKGVEWETRKTRYRNGGKKKQKKPPKDAKKLMLQTDG